VLGAAAAPTTDFDTGAEMSDTPEETAGAQEEKAGWWRAAWVSPNEKLSAQEAASTLFRFFRSQHVTDLRSIFWLASYLLISYFVVVCAIVIYEIEFLPGPPRPIHTFVYFFGPAIPVYGAVIAWTYLSAATRLGVVDLFACEIKTLCRVGTILNFGQALVDRCGAEESRFPPVSSEEDYFPVFSSNSGDLEQLEATVVGNITEFYTYMKVVRDTFRRFGAPETGKVSCQEVLNLVYMLYLAYESGRKAIDLLVEFQPTRAENIMTILLTELPCYRCLCQHFQGDQLRFTRLILRLSGYKKEVGAIIRDVSARPEKDEDWAPAKGTLPTLQECYEKMKSEVEAIQREKSATQA
jgi:hypothetical protein